MTTATHDLVTVSQAAKRLGIDRGRLFRMIRKGKLETTRCGWVYLFSEEQLTQAQEKLSASPE